MELIVMLLAPFPIGYLVRNRLAAYLAYIAVHAFVFTFQTAGLLLEWAGGSTEAFGSFPQEDRQAFWAYGAVNLAIYLVGLALVTIGHRLGTSRRTQRTQAVTLDDRVA